MCTLILCASTPCAFVTLQVQLIPLFAGQMSGEMKLSVVPEACLPPPEVAPGRKNIPCCLASGDAGGRCCHLQSLMASEMLFCARRRQKRELGGKKTMPPSKCDTMNYCATALG